MTEKVIIIGHSIAAEIIYSIISRDPRINVAAFTVHRSFIDKPVLFDKPIVPFESLAETYPPSEYKIINAIGYGNVNKNRGKIFLEAKLLGYSPLTYIHASASNFSQEIGEGVFIMPGAVIEPFSLIGANTFIWSNVVIAHHARIDENCWIASGAVVSGGARVKRNCFLGVNATIVNKVVIEEYNIIGAQTLIAKNTSAHGVYISRPGEHHRFSSDDYAKHILV